MSDFKSKNTTKLDSLLPFCYQNNEAILLIQEDDILCANQKACDLLFQTETSLIQQPLKALFIGLDLEFSQEQAIFSRDNELLHFKARCIEHRIENTLYYVMSFNKQESLTPSNNILLNLHSLSYEFKQCSSMNALYRTAVTLSITKLGFDRFGILLIDPQSNEMYGTWGTDEFGKLKDENDFRAPLPKAPWVKIAFSSKNYVVCWENKELLNYFKPVGRGWNAMVALWDGNQPFGWICCDNLISQTPMTEETRELIALWGSTLSHLIVQKRSDLILSDLNETLEEKVKLRTQALIDIQQELIETEKLTSLGRLVAGITHEVNTPLGIGITATSHLKEKNERLLETLQSGTLSKAELEKQLRNNIEASRVVEDTLSQAAKLMSSFKQLAADQSHDGYFSVNFFNLANNILTTFRLSHDTTVLMVNDIDPRISLYLQGAKLSQVLTNLVQNSILHAFHQHETPQITLFSEETEHYYLLHYQDNGCGIDTTIRQRIFEPFFTTRRGKGGTGLGLNIIYNIMLGLKGKIELAKHAEQGVHFIITLPKDHS